MVAWVIFKAQFRVKLDWICRNFLFFFLVCALKSMFLVTIVSANGYRVVLCVSLINTHFFSFRINNYSES